MKSNEQLVKEWLEKHQICGNQAWWDGKTYYNLRLEQIVSIAKYINKKDKKN